MINRRAIADGPADERGAVLVMVALFAPVMVLLAAFAIDASNWYLHKRHLQVQADAAVFAAAREFQPCVAASVYQRAGEYGGAGEVQTPSGAVTSSTPLFNEQIGGVSQSDIHELINNQRYYNQSSPVDTTAVEKSPCEASMVDVKLTETNPPWFWKHVLGLSHINAHARIEILQETSASGIEPLAVAESAPVAAQAYFVNEDNNNAVIAKTALTKIGTNAQGQDVWANSSAPLAVPLSKTNATTAHIGVVVALSGSSGDTSCPSHEYVKCFGPVMHIAGYSNTGTGTVTAPLARQVTLSNPSPSTCSDGYFSNASANCTFTVTAKVDYGSSISKGVTITPEVGSTKAKTAMTFNASTGVWTGAATLPANSGMQTVNLVVECRKESGSPCEKTSSSTATIKDVHRIFAAGEAGSGSITGAWISEVGGAPVDANSFEVCEGCTHKLVVTVNVGGSLAAAGGYSDPEHELHLEGSQNVKVDCPPDTSHSASEYRSSLEEGCPPAVVNTSDPKCTAKPTPYDCLSIDNGKATGPVEKGIIARIKEHPGSTYEKCSNWVNNNAGGVPIIPPTDSRIIELFVTPYGAVTGDVPIQDFAAFYVTGFPGDPEAGKCDPKTSNSVILGHFIKYVNTVGNGGGTSKCQETSLGICVAVLTK